MIEFKNLEVGFNQKSILRNLSGRLEPGQLIALMGTNGRGKSCLLKTLTRLLPPLDGSVFLDGLNLTNYSQKELSKKISVVLTERIEIDFLRVDEVLALGRSPYTEWNGKLGIRDKEIINEISELLKIQTLNKALFSELSDGQKQRILMARALIQEPEFLFLDEPTTFLDIPSKMDLLDCLTKMSEFKKIGILFSTHDYEFIKNKVNLIWLIDNEGRLHCGSPKDFKNSGLLTKNFNL